MSEDLIHTAAPHGGTVPEPFASPTSPPGYELIDEIGHGGCVGCGDSGGGGGRVATG